MIRPSMLVLLVVFMPTATVVADTVYFVSRSTGSLYTFDSAGGAITALTGASTFPDASALALGADGNLYVGDSTGGGSIKRYVMATGSVSTVVSLSGTAPEFGTGPVSPAAIAFTPGGAMLVGRNPESIFSGRPAGPVVQVSGWQVGGSPSVASFTSGTTLDYSPGLALAPDGTLFVSNSLYNIVPPPGQSYLTGNVLRFDASGAYQSLTAVDNAFSGGLFGPTGLALSGTSLFIASTMNGNIYRTDLTDTNTSTNTILFASTAGDYPGPLGLLADGNLLAAGVGASGAIYRFSNSGTLLETFGGAEYGQIGGIAVAPVPEPGAVVLAVVGIAGAACSLRRRSAAR